MDKVCVSGVLYNMNNGANREGKPVIQMAMPENLIEARFIKRLNRFVARVEVANREALAHVPSSGRMQELLVAGARVYVTPNQGAKRRTDYKLLLVYYGDTLVSIDSLLPNRLLNQAFRQGKIPGFTQYTTVRREFPYRQGRLDFLLTSNGERCLVEVKSVTLVENGEARFPDAPSVRGARHLEELALALGEGYRAAVMFVVQRGDGTSFAPYDERDPHFSSTLRRVRQAGVEVYALGCTVGLEAIRIDGNIPVVMLLP